VDCYVFAILPFYHKCTFFSHFYVGAQFSRKFDYFCQSCAAVLSHISEACDAAELIMGDAVPATGTRVGVLLCYLIVHPQQGREVAVVRPKALLL